MTPTELFALFELGKTCFGKYKQLQQLFSDDLLVTILQELGNIEYTGAIMSLKNVKASNDPRMQIHETIGHLRSAYLAFCGSARLRRLFGLMPPSCGIRAKSYDSAIKALLFMALCYRYLDENENADDALNMIEPLLLELRRALTDQANAAHSERFVGIGMETSVSCNPIADELKSIAEDYDAELLSIESKIASLEQSVKDMRSTQLRTLKG